MSLLQEEKINPEFRRVELKIIEILPDLTNCTGTFECNMKNRKIRTIVIDDTSCYIDEIERIEKFKLDLINCETVITNSNIFAEIARINEYNIILNQFLDVDVLQFKSL